MGLVHSKLRIRLGVLRIFGCYPAMGGHPLWPEELSADENQLDVWNRRRNDSTVLSDLTSGESKLQSEASSNLKAGKLAFLFKLLNKKTIQLEDEDQYCATTDT